MELLDQLVEVLRRDGGRIAWFETLAAMLPRASNHSTEFDLAALWQR